MKPEPIRPTFVHVDLDAVRDNVARLAEIAEVEVCAVVKADAYGHGGVRVAQAALDGGASWLGVALVEEGIELREAGIDAPLLLLAEPPVAGIPAMLEANLTPTVYRLPFVAALEAAALERDLTVSVHAKVDTGMGRVGVPLAAWEPFIRQLAQAQNLELEGVCTHLARADEPAVGTTETQIAAFDRALSSVRRLGLTPRLIHAANTAGTLLFPTSRYDLVRVGIGIYGLSPDVQLDVVAYGLEPALSLVTQVAYVKRVAVGTPLSYGHRFVAPADGWVATLPIGYADGVPRALTNAAEVLVGGRRYPIAGTVTMDQTLLWCGEDEPAVGDEAVLLGRQGDEAVRVEDWAATLGTITYEVTAQLTGRLPRLYRGGNERPAR